MIKLLDKLYIIWYNKKELKKRKKMGCTTTGAAHFLSICRKNRERALFLIYFQAKHSLFAERYFRTGGDKFMLVNGKTIPLDKPMTLLELLQAQGYQLSRIAVECNEVIISKADYGTLELSESDVIEVVSFMGGG